MQAQPPHVALSFFDWAVALGVVGVGSWMIRGLLQFYMAAKGDLQAAREKSEDERAARFLRQQESVEKTVQELIKVAAELRTWVVMEFVRQEDHRRDLARLESDISDQGEHFAAVLEAHRKECPARRS